MFVSSRFKELSKKAKNTKPKPMATTMVAERMMYNMSILIIALSLNKRPACAASMLRNRRPISTTIILIVLAFMIQSFGGFAKQYDANASQVGLKVIF